MEIRTVRLASETDFAGWRAAARALRLQRVEPERVAWTVEAGALPLASEKDLAFTAPRAFLGLARDVVLHRSEERFSLLYKILWRLAATPDLLRYPADPHVARARALALDVDRAAQRMKAFTRFHPIETAEGDAYLAWFEPGQRVTERVAPFFARRFPARFAVLTPDVCVFRDRGPVRLAPGIEPADAPGEDQLAACWRNLTRAPAVPPQRRTAMAEHSPDPRIVRAAHKAARDGAYGTNPPTTLEAVRAGVDACRRCELWREATQGVPGEGPAPARLMLVGEQPGDREDLEGRPFVGPAGAMLDRALAAAGVPRGEVYVTNAVKHFKHELRGKRRLHKTPEAGEVQACRWWLDAERRIVRPRVVVALGATAALGVFGRTTPVARSRGRALPLPDQIQGLVTYHPAYLLRVPDAAAKDEAYEAFVEDLRLAWALAGQGRAT